MREHDQQPGSRIYYIEWAYCVTKIIFESCSWYTNGVKILYSLRRFGRTVLLLKSKNNGVLSGDAC